MPTAIREEVVSRLATALETVADGLGYAFERNRFVPIEEAGTPALILYDGGETVLDGDSASITRAMGLEVEAYVTAADGALLGAAIAEVAGRIRVAMRPSAAGLLVEGYADDVREIAMTAPEIGRDARHGAFAAFTLEFEVEYRAAEFDPFSQA